MPHRCRQTAPPWHSLHARSGHGADQPDSGPATLLRHLLRLAHEEWEVTDNVPRIRLEKEPQGRLRWLTEDEASRLLAACRNSRNTALADLVEFCLFTGLR
jgi:integrase